MAFDVGTYANSRRMEKSLRLQYADLLTEYNLLEADLQRPKVGRLRSDHRQEHRPRLPALELLPGRPQAAGGVFRRDLSGRGRGRRLQAAVRSGEFEAAELRQRPLSTVAGLDDAESWCLNELQSKGEDGEAL